MKERVNTKMMHTTSTIAIL